MSFGPVQQIDAGPLDVGYVDVGPPDGQPVVLLHGWPYDIHSYAEVAPDARGRWATAWSCRTSGATARPASCRDDTVRNGQQSALALDVIDLMDSLGSRVGDRRRFRLGSAVGQRRRRALARSGARPWCR